MLKRSLLFSMVLIAALGACAPRQSLEALKKELLEIDRAFSQTSVEKGQAQAFLEYMSMDAVIYPMVGEPIRGREEYARLSSGAQPAAPESRLEWDPKFADVSSTGEIGYTLGTYKATVFPPEGEPLVSQGHYVTVWKKQADGTWRFVFDGGNQAAPPPISIQ